MMRHSIATVSLSGSLDEKLRAIASAGFAEVEIFENDFLGFNGSARNVRAMAGDLGLKIVCYQPFRDFEGLPTPARARAFSRAERKFDLMGELGTELMLVCSSVHPLALGGVDRAADDFSDLGERAAKRGLRVAYEALAWGRHISDYRDAWEIVRRTDHANIGLVLDSFHLFARGLPVDPIRSIPGDKIFLVQLADAPALHLDALSWSRHFRCFPGQGDLPIVAFSEAVAATDYSGPQSLEIFNDQFRAAPPRQMAIDGKRSLIWLEDQIARRPNERRRDLVKLPPEAVCRGVEFVEFALDAPTARAFRTMLGVLGFRLVGRHVSKAVEHWRQGSINLVVNTEEKGFAHSHFVTHGAGVCAIALSVADAAAAMARAQRLKVDPFEQHVGPGELTIPAIRGVGGSLIYFTEPRGDLSQLWSRDFRPVDTKTPEGSLAHIDHVAQNMAYNEMQSWHLFYRSIFDLAHTPQVDIVDPSGLIQSEALVSADGSLRIALNGSMAPRTQSAQLLSDYFGAGVQHLALEAPDLLGAVEAMRELGLAFLEIPDNYYDDLRAKYDLGDDFAERLRRNGVLYDRDELGAFLQIYTNRFADRFFFEIVQRDSYTGFGAANAPVRLAAQARANQASKV